MVVAGGGIGGLAAALSVGELWPASTSKKGALELGGKNMLIACDDADMALAIRGGSWASWLHQGRIRTSAGRHLVHASRVAEAVGLANDTEHGLAAGIHAADIGRGMAMAMAERIEVGPVHVNDQRVNDDGTMPMGGRGASGNGSRHGGPANWDEFTRWQWTTVRATAPRYPL